MATTASARSDNSSAVVLAEFEQQFVALVRAFGLHQGDVTPCGEPIPVSEAHALSELATRGPLSQRQLGEHLGLAKGTVSRIVDQLVERTWVRRVRSNVDARVIEVRLTSAGRAAAKRLAQRRRSRLSDLLTAIPPDRRQHVVDALALLTEVARDTT